MKDQILEEVTIYAEIINKALSASTDDMFLQALEELNNTNEYVTNLLIDYGRGVR